jgi:hypothetical protein
VPIDLAIAFLSARRFLRSVHHKHDGDLLPPLSSGFANGIEAIDVSEADKQLRHVIGEIRGAQANLSLKGVFDQAGEQPTQGMVGSDIHR